MSASFFWSSAIALRRCQSSAFVMNKISSSSRIVPAGVNGDWSNGEHSNSNTRLWFKFDWRTSRRRYTKCPAVEVHRVWSRGIECGIRFSPKTCWKTARQGSNDLAITPIWSNRTPSSNTSCTIFFATAHASSCGEPALKISSRPGGRVSCAAVELKNSPSNPPLAPTASCCDGWTSPPIFSTRERTPSKNSCEYSAGCSTEFARTSKGKYIRTGPSCVWICLVSVSISSNCAGVAS